jgi:transcriptional regulator of arginine metabolism
VSTKQQRQQIISRLIAQENIANQPQLQELLREQGIEATQATISRDLEELGAIKIRVAGGDTVYAIAEYAPARIAPSDQLRRVMAEWVAEVSSSGNLVVVRTPPGCAHVVASALDRSGLVGLLGTVAGDDTILCIATEDMSGAGLAEQLRSLSGVTDATGGIPRKKGTANV